LEKRLEEERKMQANMEKHMLVLNAQLDQSVLEVERLKAENGSLQASIHSLQNDSNVTKGVLESQLQTLEERLSVSNAELQKVIPAIIAELVHYFIIPVSCLSSVRLLQM
jgi:ABC-type phosphate transport system auxiliary subunit